MTWKLCVSSTIDVWIHPYSYLTEQDHHIEDHSKTCTSFFLFVWVISAKLFVRVRENLGILIQTGGSTVGHSSVEDAVATLDLVRWCILNKPKPKPPLIPAPVPAGGSSSAMAITVWSSFGRGNFWGFKQVYRRMLQLMVSVKDTSGFVQDIFLTFFLTRSIFKARIDYHTKIQIDNVGAQVLRIASLRPLAKIRRLLR